MADSLASCTSGRVGLAALKGELPIILPSLLLCDFGRLADEVRRLEEAGVRGLHLDVMDGHFVPNLSYGLPIVEAVRRVTDLPLDVHLMIANPAAYIDRFRHAGADGLTIHAEAVESPRELLDKIRKTGATAGLAINPPTPVSAIHDCLDGCDVCLVMSVMPGFGGQEFDPVALDKLRALRVLVGSEVLLEVDGGINESIVGPCASAGADFLVVGSAIFRSDDYKAAVARLRRAAQNNRGGS